MLKAIKENMKIWLKTHERLYWYIVVAIAVLAFGIITGMGCAKLEKAEAAEQTVKATWKGEDVYIPLGNYPYYVLIKDKGAYGDILLLSKEKLKIEFRSDGSIPLCLYDDNGNQTTAYGQAVKCYGGFNTSASSYVETQEICYGITMTGGRPSVEKVVCNYDVVNAKTGEVVYESIIGYSSDSAYVKFDSLAIDNKLNQKTVILDFKDDLYTGYFVDSTWKYNGHLDNTSPLDLSYVLNVRFTIELPTLEYVQELYDKFGYRSDKGAVVLVYNKDLVDYWYADTSAQSRSFIIDYSLELSPDEQGYFNYTLTYGMFDYLLRASSAALESELQECGAHWTSILLSFMHVKDIRSEVVTTREDCIVYGGFTTNRFERGVYGSCAEAYTKVDKDFVSSDLLEDMIDDDISVAEREYLKELEGRIEELEGQLGGMTSADNAFGDLEGSDLWTGFQSLVSGLASLAPSIRALSTLTGAVFAFMPLTVTGIMSTTLFAICIIAIIKAIRG